MSSKVKIIFITVFFILFLFPQEITAQVVINEVSPASDPEWVELYNTGQDTVSLNGYTIYFDDDPLTTQKKKFCDNDQISSNSYKLISAPGGGSSWLANIGDTLILKNGDLIVDTISYGAGQTVGAPSVTQSISRQPDGSANWIISDSLSPTGDIVSFNCPTPTPSSTPDPTAAPTSNPTSTPTPTPTPVKTPTPTPKKTLIPSPTVGPMLIASDSATNQPEVQGIRDEMNLLGVASESAGITDKKGLPIIPIILISCGGIFIIGAGLALAKKGKSEYNLKKDENVTQNN